MSSGADHRKPHIVIARLAKKGMGGCAGDSNPDDIADFLVSVFGEIDDPIVLAPALPVIWVFATVAIDQDRYLFPDQLQIELLRNPIGEVEEAVEAVLFDRFLDLLAIACRRSPRSG